MDCEKFDTVILDELYDELDEPTSADAKSHAGACTRCALLLGGLRATRRVAVLPLVEAPPELEERILTAARQLRPMVPLGRRVARGVSWAGSWAMRPQTAMAALFLLMIGSSLLLLRNRAMRPSPTASMKVTEQGAPASVAAAPSADSLYARDRARPEDPSPPSALPRGAGAGAASAAGPEFAAAMSAYQAGRFDEATRAFDRLASSDVHAAFWAARSLSKGTGGCAAALPRFDAVAIRAAGTSIGWDASYEAGVCHRLVGNFDAARGRQTRLLEVPTHAERAQAELEAMAPAVASKGAGRPAKKPTAPAGPTTAGTVKP